MKKYWLSIVIVLSTILLVVGATFAYFSFSIRANNNITADASNMSIIFTPGDELTEVVDPSSSRDNRIKTTASIRAVNGAAKPKANLYLNIEDISSSLTSGALVWEVEAVKNNQSVTLSPSSGTFENCMHNGVSGACVAGDKLYIVTDYELDYVDTEFTIYIWLDSSNISESVSDAVFNASIGADTEEFTGMLKSIPNEYQKVEYIESSGTQYIDTGIIPNQDTSINIKFKVKSTANLNGNYGSIIYSSAVEYNNRAKEIFTGPGGFEVNNGYSYKYFTLSINTSDIFQINNSKNVYTLINTNNNEEESISFVYSSFEAPYTLWLFALHRGSVLTSYLGKGALIFDCKILQNDVLVREFVPVYRKSDSVVGLYDIQNGVFYSNANNSGDDFTAGPNVS